MEGGLTTKTALSVKGEMRNRTKMRAKYTYPDKVFNDAVRYALAEPDANPRPTIDLSSMLDFAVEKVEQIMPGTEFLLTDFFETAQWEALEIGERKNLGKEFRKRAETELKIAEHIGRNGSNKAMYKRL